MLVDVQDTLVSYCEPPVLHIQFGSLQTGFSTTSVKRRLVWRRQDFGWGEGSGNVVFLLLHNLFAFASVLVDTLFFPPFCNTCVLCTRTRTQVHHAAMHYSGVLLLLVYLLLPWLLQVLLLLVVLL